MDEMNNRDIRVAKKNLQYKDDFHCEFCGYRDEGCELTGSCLHCPLPRCFRQETRRMRRWLKQIRSLEIYRLFITGHKGVQELAVTFGVSSRTVYRAVERGRDWRLSSTGGVNKPDNPSSVENAENNSESK
jgi:hypothetical protein